jgi:hypothetical protein
MKNIVESATFAMQIRDEVTANITKTIVDKLKGPVEDSRRQIEKYTEAILRRVNDSEAQLENQKVHRVGREFLSRTREEHTAEVLGHKITVLTESNEELKAERDNFEKTSIGAQKLVAKLKEEKALWQKKYLHLLEGSKRPREDDSVHEQVKRRSQSRSASTLEETSSCTLVVQPSDISGGTSARKLSRNTSEGDTMSNSRASATRPESSRRHTSPSKTSDRNDRGRSKAFTDHPHLSRVYEMSDREKRRVRDDLGMSFDPWDPDISRQGERLVTLALWKRELRYNKRYLPDYSDQKADYHRTSHDGNIRVDMKAFKDFFHRSQEWTYQEGVNDLHDDFHNYHLRNHIPRVVDDYRKISNNPKMAAYTRRIPVDCYYEEVLRDTPGFRQQALPHSSYHAATISPAIKSEKLSGETSSKHLRNNSGSPEPNALYTWADEVLGSEEEKRYRLERLSLDEIAEVERLAELINLVKAGNQDFIRQ